MSSKGSNSATNAALNPEAKAFSPVTGNATPTGASAPAPNVNANTARPPPATAPLPAGEGALNPGAMSNSSNSGAPVMRGGGGGGAGSSGGGGGYPGGVGPYVPPARQNPGVPPPLHHQNTNPNLFNGPPGTSGHGSSSFLPSHSGGGGGSRNVPHPQGGNWSSNNPHHSAVGGHHHSHSHHQQHQQQHQMGNPQQQQQQQQPGNSPNFPGYSPVLPHHQQQHQHHQLHHGQHQHHQSHHHHHQSHHLQHHHHHGSITQQQHHHNFYQNQQHHHQQQLQHHHHGHHHYHHNQHHHHQHHGPLPTGSNSNVLNSNQQQQPPPPPPGIGSNFAPHPHAAHHHHHSANSNMNQFGGPGGNSNFNSNQGGPVPNVSGLPVPPLHAIGGGGVGVGGGPMNNMPPPHPTSSTGGSRGMSGSRGRGHHGTTVTPTRRTENRKAVVVLGAPKSGKTTLAKKIASDIPNFHYIEAPLDREKFETLSSELKELGIGEHSTPHQDSSNSNKMLVLDGFGADHDADLYYLSSVLKRNNFAVYGLVYLNLAEPAKTIRARQEDVAPSTAQMFGHAVAYETCSQYDTGNKNLILIGADQPRDAVFQDFKKAWEDAAISPLEVVAPRVLKSIDRSCSWKMLAYGEFKNVTAALEASLPKSASSGTGTSPMPLRSAFGPLTYAHFSRWFSRLPKYQLSLMTNGQRIVLFAFNGYLYFLPEHGYYVFRYDPAGTGAGNARVTQWFDDLSFKCADPETMCPLVLDAEYVIFQGEEYILLRDVLVCGSEPCYNLPLRERVERMTGTIRVRDPNDPNVPSIQILPHRYASVDKVSEIFAVWDRAEETDDASQTATKVGVGVRLEPPGEYVIGQHDPNLLYWFDPQRIAIVVRLWNVVDDDEGQTFTVLGVDDSTGLETSLPRDCPLKVKIPADIVANEQLGEGHVVELTIHRRLTNPPPASRGGRSQNRSQSDVLEFRFERRRWDIAVPYYLTTISSIIHQVKHSWSKEYFKSTCELVSQLDGTAASGEGTPMTPSSPVAMN